VPFKLKVPGSCVGHNVTSGGAGVEGRHQRSELRPHPPYEDRAMRAPGH
jgi:hypothetical protein